MDEIAKLKAVLRKAAGDGVTGPRAEPIASAEAGVAYILDAVDTTLLPRRLTVTASGGGVLILEAAARRLQRAAEPAPPSWGLATGTELKPEDASQIIAAMTAFCAGQSSLLITAMPISEAGDPTEGGIAPALLRETLGVTPPPPRDPEADMNMEPFITGLGKSCLAALWIQDGEVSILVGPKERAGLLSQWAVPMLERLLDAEFPLSAGFETDGLFVFVLPEAQGRHALIAGRLGAYIVAEIEGADPTETVAAWHAALG